MPSSFTISLEPTAWGWYVPEVFYSAGGAIGASSIVAADVNLDGKLDLVLIYDTTFEGGVGVLLGNGDGTFHPVTNYAW